MPDTSQMYEQQLRMQEGEIDRLRGLLWFAWYEFNAIRARDGAPTADGVPLVDLEWWSKMTEAFSDAIGEEATTPWMSKEAKTTPLAQQKTH